MSIPLPKQVEERIKEKVKSMTLDELIPPAYGTIYISRFGAVLMDIQTLGEIDPKYLEHFEVMKARVGNANGE